MANEILGLNTINDGRIHAPNVDRRALPVYPLGEAADLISIPHRTMHDWALGSAVLEHVNPKIGRLSFFDLVEAHILRAARERKLPLQRIKRGLTLLRNSRPDIPRPLLSYDFLTDGKNLLVRGMLENDDLDSPDTQRLVNATEYGQIELAKLIEEHLRFIGRDDEKVPNVLFPSRGERLISINPGVFSGRPVIEGTRIPTKLVAQRHHAGESPDQLAESYGLERDKIVAALRFEKTAA